MAPSTSQRSGPAPKKANTILPPKLPDDPFHTLMTEKQAAAYLGWTERTLQQRRYSSLPPEYIKLPGSSAVRYRLSVLMDFVSQGEVPLP